MATTKRPATTRSRITDEGNAALEFLRICRKDGFMVSQVTVGSFSAVVTDLRPHAPAEAKGTKPPRTVHDAYADDYGLPRPSDAAPADDEDGEP